MVGEDARPRTGTYGWSTSTSTSCPRCGPTATGNGQRPRRPGPTPSRRRAERPWPTASASSGVRRGRRSPWPRRRASPDVVEDELYRFARTVERRRTCATPCTDPALPDGSEARRSSPSSSATRANPTTVGLLGVPGRPGAGPDLPKIVDTPGRAGRGAPAARGGRGADRRPARRRAAPALAEALSRRPPGRTLELKVLVDDSVIGGVVARVGDQVFDGTVRRKLELARQQIGQGPAERTRHQGFDTRGPGTEHLAGGDRGGAPNVRRGLSSPRWSVRRSAGSPAPATAWPFVEGLPGRDGQRAPRVPGRDAGRGLQPGRGRDRRASSSASPRHIEAGRPGQADRAHPLGAGRRRLLGRVIDAIGRPVDGKGPIAVRGATGTWRSRRRRSSSASR